jgi:hypothetical protein
MRRVDPSDSPLWTLLPIEPEPKTSFRFWNAAAMITLVLLVLGFFTAAVVPHAKGLFGTGASTGSQAAHASTLRPSPKAVLGSRTPHAASRPDAHHQL